MNKKVLVSLYVPCVGQKYDIYVPVFLEIREVAVLLSEAVEKLTNGKYHATGDELLCEKENNIVLDMKCQIQDYNIKNGDELILI